MAPQRSRLRPVRGSTVVGGLAAGVLIIALVIAGRSLHGAPDRPEASPTAAAVLLSLGPAWPSGRAATQTPAGRVLPGHRPGDHGRSRASAAAGHVTRRGAPLPCDDARFACERGTAFMLEQEGFVVPPGYGGVAGQAVQGGLAVAVATRASDPTVACEGRQQPVATLTPRGIRGRMLGCVGGWIHLDSVLVRWRERGWSWW